MGNIGIDAGHDVFSEPAGRIPLDNYTCLGGIQHVPLGIQRRLQYFGLGMIEKDVH